MDESCPEPSWHLAHRAKIQHLVESVYGPLLAHTCSRPLRIGRSQTRLAEDGDESDLTQIQPIVWQSRWKEPPHVRVRISTVCQCLNVLLDVWPNDEGTAIQRDNLAQQMERERSLHLSPVAA